MRKILMLLVRGYQKFISPLSRPHCRFYPSCSSYMLTALSVHGAFKGTLMGISRLLRCQPFAHGGLDFVPKQFSLRRNTVDQEKPDYSL